MNSPLVSIIIPVYNGENFLRESIESALGQTYPNIEVIVVNDGSNDHGATENIILSYGNKIRYYSKDNGGVATALNLAINEMEGEYFSWLSHDDLYYPNKIETQINALNENGNMHLIVQSDYDLLDVNSQTITHVQQSETFSEDKLTNSVFPILQGLVHGCSLLIHKSHFERVGVFNESLITTQDYDLWFRMLRHQKSIYVKEALVLSRLHSTQSSKTMTCHQPEREQLYFEIMNALTEDEMVSMYGSVYNFYHRMSVFFKGGQMNDSYKYANQKLQDSAIPENLSEELVSLENYMKEFSAGKADRICIFSAGEYGIRLYQELRSKLINIHCFSDNNPAKWGYLFNGIECVSPESLEIEKERTLVIVANRAPKEIIQQLTSKGFPYVTTKQEIDKVLINVPPVKWITALEGIEGLDYSSKDALLLMAKFSETIYDICKYYEARVQKKVY
jgi:glycosyltransferase involved in cell wall biosynthesis